MISVIERDILITRSIPYLAEAVAFCFDDEQIAMN